MLFVTITMMDVKLRQIYRQYKSSPDFETESALVNEMLRKNLITEDDLALLAWLRDPHGIGFCQELDIVYPATWLRPLNPARFFLESLRIDSLLIFAYCYAHAALNDMDSFNTRNNRYKSRSQRRQQRDPALRQINNSNELLDIAYGYLTGEDSRESLEISLALVCHDEEEWEQADSWRAGASRVRRPLTLETPRGTMQRAPMNERAPNWLCRIAILILDCTPPDSDCRSALPLELVNVPWKNLSAQQKAHGVKLRVDRVLSMLREALYFYGIRRMSAQAKIRVRNLTAQCMRKELYPSYPSID